MASMVNILEENISVLGISLLYSYMSEPQNKIIYSSLYDLKYKYSYRNIDELDILVPEV